ncbi:hypothetical protein [Ketogulonicigenium vulgare]|uniref:hypothetical protein n=1 Tax=Ketogulonicigenium vulgare TaxID=92945 RepID=UPI00235972D4|nr:hypothetical protein [Ketogulonicigenium vulgare]
MFDAGLGDESARAMWCEVLIVAVRDATKPSQSKDPAEIRAKQEAVKYLTKTSHDLAKVCSFAGVDMDALIRKMREVLPKTSISKI